MSKFTMRATWPDNPDRPDDFVFRVDGHDTGRCYRMTAAYDRECWLWTIYCKQSGGMADTLEEAQRLFKEAIENGDKGQAGRR